MPQDLQGPGIGSRFSQKKVWRVEISSGLMPSGGGHKMAANKASKIYYKMRQAVRGGVLGQPMFQFSSSKRIVGDE